MARIGGVNIANHQHAEIALTAVYGHDGRPLVQAAKMGTVVVTEVDLSRRFFWRNNLGDFRAEVYRERPATIPEPREKAPGNPK